MIGGKFMSYRYERPSAIIRLSGEEGRKIFCTILEKTTKFDVKKADGAEKPRYRPHFH